MYRKHFADRTETDRKQIANWPGTSLNDMVYSESQALKLINEKLAAAGCSLISRSILYKCRSIYAATFPRSQWFKNGQLIYSESVILFLYFVARMHIQLNVHLQRPNWHATKLGVIALIRQLDGQRFSEVYGSFSSVNSYFSKEQVA